MAQHPEKSSHNSSHDSIGDAKISKVMGEFKRRKLRSSSGQLVTNRKQAIAIGFSEAKRLNKSM